MNGKSGADRLTKTLNGYMGALVEEILSFDGDVLKYAGKYSIIFFDFELLAQRLHKYILIIGYDFEFFSTFSFLLQR